MEERFRSKVVSLFVQCAPSMWRRKVRPNREGAMRDCEDIAMWRFVRYECKRGCESKKCAFTTLKRLRDLVKGKRTRFAKLTKASVMCQKLTVEND